MEDVAIGSSAAVFVIREGLKHCDSAAQCKVVKSPVGVGASRV